MSEAIQIVETCDHCGHSRRRWQCPDCGRTMTGINNMERHIVARHKPDAIAVDRAMGGSPPTVMTIAERREAIARLHRQGLSARLIGERVGVVSRTVQRHLAAARRAA